MITIIKQIYAILAAIMISVLACGCSNNDQGYSYSLLFISSEGLISRYTSAGEHTIIQQDPWKFGRWAGWGSYYEGFFYFVEKGILYKTNIQTMERETLFSLNELPQYKNKDFWHVAHVDDKRVILRDGNALILLIDKQLRKITVEIVLPDSLSGAVTAYENRIYFTDKRYNICCYHDGNVEILGIKGFTPSVSPDGTKIAYEFSGIFRSIHIFDLETRQDQSIFTLYSTTFFGPIRWSKDSALLAVQEASDLWAPDNYVVSTVPHKYKDTINKVGGCDWYFE